MRHAARAANAEQRNAGKKNPSHFRFLGPASDITLGVINMALFSALGPAILGQKLARGGHHSIARRARQPVRNNLGPPMTLASMRKNGVRAVTATCETCRREADVNVDALPETVTVPKAGLRLRCSRCGGKRVLAWPAWQTARRQGVPDFRPHEEP